MEKAKNANDFCKEYSVLMSVYYKENPLFLEQAIRSMLEQTIQPEQFVIVKDGPLTDELDAVINRFQTMNVGLFTIVCLESNKGLGRALDEGIKFCRNELIARMDSDDISLPDRCEKQLKLFQKDMDLSICSGTIAEFVDDPNNIVSYRDVPEKQEELKKRMRIRSCFNHPTVMYKKSEVLRCGGYGALKRKQDHDLFSRMINSDCKGYNIQSTILLFRSDNNNIKRRKSWSNCSSYIISQWNILKRGHCTVFDFVYVLGAQVFFLIAPNSLVKVVTYKFLRKKAE